jgi:DNA-binding LytR/AlgR family response regulator
MKPSRRPPGKDALAVLRSDQEVDVLFTDINLRGEKRAGLELAEKAVELRPDLAVLYTTGGDVRSPMVAGSEFLRSRTRPAN